MSGERVPRFVKLTHLFVKLIVCRSRTTVFYLPDMHMQMNWFLYQTHFLQPAAPYRFNACWYLILFNISWSCLVLMFLELECCSIWFYLSTRTVIPTVAIMTLRDTYVIKKPVLQASFPFHFCVLTSALLLFHVHCSFTSSLMSIIYKTT